MKIALIGYGKMGKAIEALAVAQNHEIIQKFDVDNVLCADALAGADVAIEFTTPEAAPKNIAICLQAGVPVVVGSTGWYAHLPQITTLCTQHGGAMITATNFSVGVHIFLKINEAMAKIMAQFTEYDVHINEIHHTEKLDAPSGTAITTAEKILPHLPQKTRWQAHTPDIQPDIQPDILQIHSQRIPNTPGTHTVNYTSMIDDLTLTHTAHNRTGFAHGALLAAAWIINKKGVFTIKDMLG